LRVGTVCGQQITVDKKENSDRITTMKLTLTADEAAPYVSARLGLPEDTEVTITDTEITGTNTAISAQLRILVEKATREVDALCPRPEEKIPAIKKLREFTAYGLAESKWCVENWEEFKQFVKDHGRFPVLKYNGMNTSGSRYLLT
jgi:ribosomal protein L7/L12